MAFLMAMGVSCRFVAIAYDRKPGFRHVFVEWWTREDSGRMDVTVPPGTIHIEDERMVVYAV
jgi:hypothetical protein